MITALFSLKNAIMVLYVIIDKQNKPTKNPGIIKSLSLITFHLMM